MIVGIVRMRFSGLYSGLRHSFPSTRKLHEATHNCYLTRNFPQLKGGSSTEGMPPFQESPNQMTGPWRAQEPAPLTQFRTILNSHLRSRAHNAEDELHHSSTSPSSSPALFTPLRVFFQKAPPNKSSVCTLCPFDMSPFILKHFLAFCHIKIMQAHLLLFLP